MYKGWKEVKSMLRMSKCPGLWFSKKYWWYSFSLYNLEIYSILNHVLIFYKLILFIISKLDEITGGRKNHIRL